MEIERICQTCEHFYQHYVKFPNGKFVEYYSGHCVYPRRKLRYGSGKACPHYVQKEDEPPQ